MNGFTKSTAVFYRQDGIRANAVLPGAVATNIEAPFESERAVAVLGPLMQANITEVATPEQQAATITWLLSDDASNINGAPAALRRRLVGYLIPSRPPGAAVRRESPRRA